MDRLSEQTPFEVLIDIVGVEPAYNLIRQLNNRELTIPARDLSSSHVLVKSLGLNSALKVQRMFRGERIKLPVKLRKWRAEAKRKQVLQLKGKGMTNEQVSKALGIPTRSVSYHASKNKDDILTNRRCRYRAKLTKSKRTSYRQKFLNP